jgi:RNA polymerase sigma-70 factor (ECF subfamily)
MLGSSHEADDAVQETWLRLGRVDVTGVENLRGWLTTVVGRVSLDMLRGRARRPQPEPDPPEAPGAAAGVPTTPEDEALLADSVGLALLVVLDTLSPAERLAFVLHDMFGVPFDEIAPIAGRTPAATRQLASRARRRVRADPAYPTSPAAGQDEVVAAFLAASRDGQFGALLQLLDPDVVLRADAVAVAMAAERAAAGAPDLPEETRGADAVARVFAGRARVAVLRLVDGRAGAVVPLGRQGRIAFEFSVRDGRVVSIDLLADPDTVGALEVDRLDRR